MRASIIEQLFYRTEEVFGFWKTRIYRQSTQVLVVRHFLIPYLEIYILFRKHKFLETHTHEAFNSAS